MHWYESNIAYSMHKYHYRFEYGVDDAVYPYLNLSNLPWFLERMRETSIKLVNYLVKNRLGTKEFLEAHTGENIMGVSDWRVIAAENEARGKDIIHIKVVNPIQFKYYVDALYPSKPSLPPLPSADEILEFIQEGSE